MCDKNANFQKEKKFRHFLLPGHKSGHANDVMSQFFSEFFHFCNFARRSVLLKYFSCVRLQLLILYPSLSLTLILSLSLPPFSPFYLPLLTPLFTPFSLSLTHSLFHPFTYLSSFLSSLLTVSISLSSLLFLLACISFLSLTISVFFHISSFK